jgi:hypothetical protein
MLCVLLAHALAIHVFLLPGAERRAARPEFASEPIYLELPRLAPATEPRAEASPRAQVTPSQESIVPSAAEAPVVAESSAVAAAGRVDWPLEGQKSAARVLAQEAENERVARLFAGPGGTWRSLTRRQRSAVAKFRWKPGVDGPEYDEQGNAIYHLNNGCVLVNLTMIGCPIGKEEAYGDLFDDMRLYFDERRLPETGEGNGTEPEARRPAN